jgi:hypothetical protein
MVSCTRNTASEQHAPMKRRVDETARRCGFGLRKQKNELRLHKKFWQIKTMYLVTSSSRSACHTPQALQKWR